MNSSNRLLRPLPLGTEPLEVHLTGLRDIRLQMDEAVCALDWSRVLRLDRLCAQVVADINSLDEMNAADIVEEMLKIKKLYAQAIRFLNHEMQRYPHQVC